MCIDIELMKCQPQSLCPPPRLGKDRQNSCRKYNSDPENRGYMLKKKLKKNCIIPNFINNLPNRDT